MRKGQLRAGWMAARSECAKAAEWVALSASPWAAKKDVNLVDSLARKRVATKAEPSVERTGRTK